MPLLDWHDSGASAKLHPVMAFKKLRVVLSSNFLVLSASILVTRRVRIVQRDGTRRTSRTGRSGGTSRTGSRRAGLEAARQRVDNVNS